MMRVITGTAKGVRLDTLEGETTRPTSERAKEAMFSMIQFEIEGRRVLDLFAGSGQLGIEAISRGAHSAVFVDRSREAVSIIRKNVEKTKFGEIGTVVNTDFLSYLRHPHGQKFDLVLLDPPYALGAVPTALREMLRREILLPEAMILCETGDPADVFGGDETLASVFEIRRRVRHGAAHITLLAWRGKETSQ